MTSCRSSFIFATSSGVPSPIIYNSLLQMILLLYINYVTLICLIRNYIAINNISCSLIKTNLNWKINAFLPNVETACWQNDDFISILYICTWLNISWAKLIVKLFRSFRHCSSVCFINTWNLIYRMKGIALQIRTKHSFLFITFVARIFIGCDVKNLRH